MHFYGFMIVIFFLRTVSHEKTRESAHADAGSGGVPDRDTAFRDGVQGLYHENLAHDCGDFIIRRSLCFLIL